MFYPISIQWSGCGSLPDEFFKCNTELEHVEGNTYLIFCGGSSGPVNTHNVDSCDKEHRS